MNSAASVRAIVIVSVFCSVMLMPTAITNAVPMSMCSISFILNLNPLLGIIGA